MENTIENATAFLDELSDAFPKMRFSQAMVEYAASVRPEVVVPSEKIHNEYIDDNSEWAEKNGWNACLSELRRLNPTIAFTELNHEK